jgi:hypothetical protein
MSENKRLCDYCHQYRPWLWTEKRLKDGSKQYVDDKNARWAGKRCPDCERKRVRAALKCTAFERDLVFKELQKQGFEILCSTFPLRVKKEGREFTVGVRYATTKNGQIVLEDDGLQNSSDLYVLLFASARTVTKEQVERLSIQTVQVVPEHHQSMLSRPNSEVLG